MDDSDQDYHNFSTSSSHRLPTISGTQAIRQAIRDSRPIPTSLTSLDAILNSPNVASATQGGIRRGAVTEIYGPPGVGKTTFSMQLAVNAIYSVDDTSNVTWIDTSSPMIGDRLGRITHSQVVPTGINLPSSPPDIGSTGNVLLNERFHYMQVTTLHQLLALFLHPSPAFPFPNTTLIVLEDLSNLILWSLPRTNSAPTVTASQQTPISMRNDHSTKQSSTRRFHVLSNLSAALQNFAATHNIAIVTTCKATVNLRAGQKAVLRSALTSQQWDTCVSVRILLYRDFWATEDRENNGEETTDDDNRIKLLRAKNRTLRYAQIMRLGGKEVISKEIPFIIEEDGLLQIADTLSSLDVNVRPAATQQVPDFSDILNGDDPDTEAEAQGGLSMQGSTLLPQHSVNRRNEIDLGKRKAGDIADSEDEETVDKLGARSAKTPTGSQRSYTKPASRDSEETSVVHDITFQTAKKFRTHGGRSIASEPVTSPERHTGVMNETAADDEEDEMLLDLHERQVPAFSQAAAEMSDPLTPSDDGTGHHE